MATKKDVLELTEQAGVYVDTWSPGDGVTRYRFASVPGCYFSWSHVDTLATCLGARDAVTFLRGMLAGQHVQQQRSSRTG